MLSGYKTYIFNGIMAIILLVQMFSPEAEMPTAEAVEGAAGAVEEALLAVTLVGNLILRAITNSSVFFRK